MSGPPFGMAVREHHIHTFEPELQVVGNPCFMVFGWVSLTVTAFPGVVTERPVYYVPQKLKQGSQTTCSSGSKD